MRNTVALRRWQFLRLGARIDPPGRGCLAARFGRGGIVIVQIPKLSLVILIGASGSGKSTFARKHFLASETLSSDQCRGIVSNDENSQEATNDAFDLLYYILRKRLERGLLTVIDATNVQQDA